MVMTSCCRFHMGIKHQCPVKALNVTHSWVQSLVLLFILNDQGGRFVPVTGQMWVNLWRGRWIRSTHKPQWQVAIWTEDSDCQGSSLRTLHHPGADKKTKQDRGGCKLILWRIWDASRESVVGGWTKTKTHLLALQWMAKKMNLTTCYV